MDEKQFLDTQGLIVSLIDENGDEVEFDHLLTFKHLDQMYVALQPLDDVEGIEEGEVVILQVVTENGEDQYITVENEILLEEAFQTFLELYEEMLDNED